MKLKSLLITILIASAFIACKNNNEPNDSPTACFTFTYGGDTEWDRYVIFSNCSENATSYHWDFGDSTYSTEKNPTNEYDEDGIYTVCLTSSNNKGNSKVTDSVLVNWSMAEKPNIYLYPKSNIDICVDIEFPQGGQVIKSIPDYNGKWCVNVNPDGIIDNEYGFLFYESVQPDVWQYEKGWCIKKENLKDFFETNMESYNFSETEIDDFIEYWIPKLSDYEYYKLYPQTNVEIDKVVKLNFSIRPDNIYRLFYGIIGCNENVSINPPNLKKIDRSGFTIVEWGGFVK